MSGASKYCFVVNCASKAHSSEKFFRQYEDYIEVKLPGSVIKYIRSGDSIKEFVSSKINSFTHFVACGGDGTVNQVANALAGKDKVLGVLPMGSGNDFARNIGLTGDFVKDFSILMNGTVKRIDTIQTEHDLFVNTFGIGIDGLTNYYASRSKFKSGFFKYFFGGLKALYKADLFDAKLTFSDNNVIDHRSVWMVAVANGKTEGGRYMISPDSDTGDGKAEVIIVKGIPRLSLFIQFIKLSLGLVFKESIIFKYDLKDKLNVSCSKQRRSHSDGEQMGNHKSYYFEMKKKALTVITGN